MKGTYYILLLFNHDAQHIGKSTYYEFTILMDDIIVLVYLSWHWLLINCFGYFPRMYNDN